ncbi:hypothetical protein QV000_07230 [Stenotrophomonas maltophilia]
MADGTFYEADQALAEKDAEIARLRAEVEAYRKDAGRYRWLRDPSSDVSEGGFGLAIEHMGNCYFLSDADKAIDAAMGASA